jgi:hypothetical protein
VLRHRRTVSGSASCASRSRIEQLEATIGVATDAEVVRRRTERDLN